MLGGWIVPIAAPMHQRTHRAVVHRRILPCRVQLHWASYHVAASMARAVNPLPILRSTAGPTTNGPMPMASSEYSHRCEFVATAVRCCCNADSAAYGFSLYTSYDKFGRSPSSEDDLAESTEKGKALVFVLTMSSSKLAPAQNARSPQDFNMITLRLIGCGLIDRRCKCTENTPGSELLAGWPNSIVPMPWASTAY